MRPIDGNMKLWVEKNPLTSASVVRSIFDGQEIKEESAREEINEINHDGSLTWLDNDAVNVGAQLPTER